MHRITENIKPLERVRLPDDKCPGLLDTYLPRTMQKKCCTVPKMGVVIIMWTNW